MSVIKPPSNGKLEKVGKLAFSHGKLPETSMSFSGRDAKSRNERAGFDSALKANNSCLTNVHTSNASCQHNKVGQKVGVNRNLF